MVDIEPPLQAELWLLHFLRLVDHGLAVLETGFGKPPAVAHVTGSCHFLPFVDPLLFGCE